MCLCRLPLLVLVAALLSVAATLPTAVYATTIHVPADQPTIQGGLNAAGSGDTVLVACGTYYEHDISMKSGICLRSETGKADCVTIHAQGLGRVLYCDGVDNSARIEGFTITGGLATGDSWPPNVGGGMSCNSSFPTLTNCTFSGNSATNYGGGMYCNYSSPTLADCIFLGNSVDVHWGGGVYCHCSSPSLTDCTFYGNSAGEGGGGISSFDLPSPTLSNCTFSGNSTNGFYGGGGILCFSSSPTVTGCTFSGNSANGFVGGGGISCCSCSPAVTDCIFSGNSASRGGGISCYYSSPTVTGCIFSGNSAGNGGGISCDVSFPPIANCTFSENSASVNGASLSYSLGSSSVQNTIIAFSTSGRAIYCDDAGSVPALSCCDVYGNAGGDWVGCIAGQAGTNGNFSSDPLFCAPESGDFRLNCTSPCANRSGCGQIGAFGVGCGPTAVHNTTWGRIKSMFR